MLQDITYDPKVRMMMIRALGTIGDPRAVASLTGQFQEKDPNIRETVIESLGKIRDHHAVNLLVQVL